jgi:tetratricopeptide (TPR) repeat protein
MTLALRRLAAACAAGLALAACSAPTPTPAPSPTPSQAIQARLEAVKAALKAGQLDAALQEAQAAVAADPQNSDAHYLLGNAYNQLAGTAADEAVRRDYLAKAVDAYLTAIQRNPGHDAAHTNLATVYYQNGQFDEAQKAVEQALQLKPDDATSHYVLGTIHLQRDPQAVPDALDKAQAEFEAALKYDPALGAAYIGLANVYLFKGDHQKALEYARQGIDAAPDHPDAFSYWALAQAQCALGDKAGGAQSIEKILALNPPDPFFRQQVQALADRCK